MSSTIESLRHLLRLAESAQAAQDDDLARTALVVAELLARSDRCGGSRQQHASTPATEASSRDDSPINMAPVLEYMRALTSCCDHCYMTRSEEELAELRQKVIQELARHNTKLIDAVDQKSLQLSPMIRLVTAMYVRQVGDMIESVSVALVVDEKDVVQFPRRGPLIDELQKHCDSNLDARGDPDFWLPGELSGYRLMVGSVEVQKILPEELQAMSF